MADAPSALPKANILNPTYDSFVGSTGNVEVTVGAEAAQGLREVTVFADGEIVATIPFARIDTDDRHGRINTYVGEGVFTNDFLSQMSGTRAVVEVAGLQKLMRYICKNGFAHHAASGSIT